VKTHPVFLPLSWGYAGALWFRNWLFDRGFLPVTNVAKPVISVGNIIAGGAGKTPFVIWLAGRLIREGKNVAVLSRGYGRRTHGYLVVSGKRGILCSVQEAGDEPIEIASKLPGALVVVDEKRVRGARRIVAEHDVDLILLDDGFQHRFLHRDVDIALIPADDDRPMHLLPAGLLREPPSALRRADLIVVTRCRNSDDMERIRTKFKITRPVVGMGITVRSILDYASGERRGADFLRGKKVLLLSALGRPGAFQTTVVQCGARIVRRYEFPDHHWYTAADIHRVALEFNQTGADLVLTTSKDAVRMTKEMEGLGSIPLHVVETDLHVVEGEEHLVNILGIDAGRNT
jgi:tetraacyldisaccharide 4'-kinase